MAAWRTLSAEEWLAHPLNRVRGWIGLVVGATVLFFVLEPALWLYDISERQAGRGPSVVLMEGRPLWVQILEWSVFEATGLAFLWSVWSRWHYAPELNLGLTALIFAQTIVIAATFLDPSAESDWLAWVGFAAWALIALAVVLYLFLGSRPNVMFRRRVRDAA